MRFFGNIHGEVHTKGDLKALKHLQSLTGKEVKLSRPTRRYSKKRGKPKCQ